MHANPFKVQLYLDLDQYSLTENGLKNELVLFNYSIIS